MSRLSLLSRVVALTATVLSVAASGAGQDLNPRLSFVGGSSNFRAQRTFAIGSESFQSQYAAGGQSAIRFTVDVKKPWALEAAYSYGTNNLRMMDVNSSNVVTGQRDFGARVRQFTVNAHYMLGEPTGRIRYFATAGLGVKRVSPTDAAKVAAATVDFINDKANISSSTSPDFNMGGGIEAKLTNSVGVRFDLRDHLSAIPRFGLAQSSSTGVYYPVSGHVSHIESAIGIVYYIH